MCVWARAGGDSGRWPLLACDVCGRLPEPSPGLGRDFPCVVVRGPAGSGATTMASLGPQRQQQEVGAHFTPSPPLLFLLLFLLSLVRSWAQV